METTTYKVAASRFPMSIQYTRCSLPNWSSKPQGPDCQKELLLHFWKVNHLTFSGASGPISCPTNLLERLADMETQGVAPTSYKWGYGAPRNGRKYIDNWIWSPLYKRSFGPLLISLLTGPPFFVNVFLVFYGCLCSLEIFGIIGNFYQNQTPSFGTLLGAYLQPLQQLICLY